MSPWSVSGSQCFWGSHPADKNWVCPTDFLIEKMYHQRHCELTPLTQVSFQGLWDRLDCSPSAWVQVPCASVQGSEPPKGYQGPCASHKTVHLSADA